MARQKTLEIRFPAITVSLICLALIVYAWPHLSDLLVYDRDAVVRGEIWRLFTAPFVHFSLSHIFWDLLVYGAAGWMIETAGYRYYWLVCCLAAVIPGPVFLLISPELTRYGGTSGLATAAVVYLCLRELKGTGTNRILWLTIFALIGAKTIVEAVTGTPIFTSTGNVAIRVLPSVHVVGCAAALVAFIWTWPNNMLHSHTAEPHR